MLNHEIVKKVTCQLKLKQLKILTLNYVKIHVYVILSKLYLIYIAVSSLSLLRYLPLEIIMIRAIVIAHRYTSWILFSLLIVGYVHPQSTQLDSAYTYLGKGNTELATRMFEDHLLQDPNDNKIHMQLGYIYYSENKFDKSLKHFQYVGSHSKDQNDIETSRSAVFVIKDELAAYSPRSMDLYFYNFYDSYQENYIANFVGHYNFKIINQFYTGLYLDLYTDTRSTPEVVYNDRFVEIGGFLRYNFLKNLYTEFRIGYAREIDKDSSKINIKPMLIYFNRLGSPNIFVSSKSTSRTGLYLDLYYAAMYDYKFKNAFLNAAIREVLRFNTGGYSYIESYLVQYIQFDSRKLSYNNYAELGTGVKFHPNIAYFPALFVEPTYKSYFYGETKNSVQLKAGFEFIFRTRL